MSRSRLATQVSAIEQRSCDDHEICVRSHSRMMLELMREREATVRLMRIARDREARQRSCAEQHGWTAPSSAPSIQEPACDPPLADRFWGLPAILGETADNWWPRLDSKSKRVLTKYLFLDPPEGPGHHGPRRGHGEG